MSKKKLQHIEDFVCPVRRALDLVSGKWSFEIIYTLMSGTKRFKELERAVEGISTRMLVKELKNLEAKGIINRKAYATVPPTVEYSLTQKGAALQPVMNAIHAWAMQIHN